MGYVEPYIYFFVANFFFVLVSLQCGITRWLHVCNPYRGYEQFYFPAFVPAVAIFCVQILEFPYLLNVFSSDTLFAVTTFALLFYPPMYKFIWVRYFYSHPLSKKYVIKNMILPFLIVFILYTFVLLKREIPYKEVFMGISLVVFAVHVFLMLRSQRETARIIRKHFLMKYSNPKDFPSRPGKRLLYVPLAYCFLVLVTYLAQDGWVKLGRDILLGLLNFNLFIYILDPHREGAACTVRIDEDKMQEEENEWEGAEEEDESIRQNRLSDEQRFALEDQIVELVAKQELFKNTDLTLNDLTERIGTNRNYVSEAISRSEYGSFYKMVNSYRIKYAMELMSENPCMKLDEVAHFSGFSSRVTFSRAFKDLNNMSPSAWKEKIA